jgi:hypothetical protein
MEAGTHVLTEKSGTSSSPTLPMRNLIPWGKLAKRVTRGFRISVIFCTYYHER